MRVQRLKQPDQQLNSKESSQLFMVVSAIEELVVQVHRPEHPSQASTPGEFDVAYDNLPQQNRLWLHVVLDLHTSPELFKKQLYISSDISRFGEFIYFISIN